MGLSDVCSFAFVGFIIIIKLSKALSVWNVVAQTACV